jgi:hypothetical protein
MKDRIALVRHGLLIRALIASLVLSLGGLAAGCGAKPGTDASSTSQEVPQPAKNLQEHMKKQAAMKKGAMGKGQRPGPAGR